MTLISLIYKECSLERSETACSLEKTMKLGKHGFVAGKMKEEHDT